MRNARRLPLSLRSDEENREEKERRETEREKGQEGMEKKAVRRERKRKRERAGVGGKGGRIWREREMFTGRDATRQADKQRKVTDNLRSLPIRGQFGPVHEERLLPLLVLEVSEGCQDGGDVAAVVGEDCKAAPRLQHAMS